MAPVTLSLSENINSPRWEGASYSNRGVDQKKTRLNETPKKRRMKKKKENR